MRNLFFLLLVAAVAPVASAKDYDLGDVVVVINDVDLKVRRNGRVHRTDKVFPGVAVRVGAINGRWLWVSNGVPGWIKNSDVIPLDNAIDHFTDRIDRSPADPRWRYARAVTWMNKGEWDIAIADYSELIRLRRSAPFYHVRGICYYAKGSHDRAIDDFNEAIRINPRSARYYNSRSEAWYEKQEYDKALKDSRKAIQLEPNLASAYTNRGKAYNKQGDTDLAVEDFKKSLKLDPNFDLAYTHYAWLLATSDQLQIRDGELAVKYATKACRLTNWEEPHALGTLAAAHAEAGNFEAAVKWEEKAQQLYSPEMKAKWAFLLELYRADKPYRQGEDPMAG